MSLENYIHNFTHKTDQLNLYNNLEPNLMFQIICEYNQIIIYAHNYANPNEYRKFNNIKNRLHKIMAKCRTKYTYNLLSGNYN